MRRFGSTRWAVLAIRTAVTLAAFCALLVIAVRPARAQTEAVLYDFGGSADGADPYSALTSHDGNFYGTTYYGGLNYGTVFELSPNGGGGWNETVLYSFTGEEDGANPSGPVTFDNAGNLYGTTSSGGYYNTGVVFELSQSGASWTETVLSHFVGGADGANPGKGLIMDSAGNLYGTTASGGSSDAGVVFELSPSAGGWTEQVIYNVDNANVSQGGLTMDAAGDIFVVGNPTLFELSPDGNGGRIPTVIHTFTGTPKDGSDAIGPAVLDSSGNLYGITYEGGAKNYGTVYKLSPGRNGRWTEKILHSFGSGKDGKYPTPGIVFDAAGNIYGTTSFGGKPNAGTVFELMAPVGPGGYKEKVLWSFPGTDGIYSDGAFPDGSLILDSAGYLYGTTESGGKSAANGDLCGVVFEINPSATATTTTLSSAPNPSTNGEAVTFTAVVTSISGVPPDGETASFMKGSTALGTGALSGGTTSFATSVLKVGTTTVTAVYAGDFDFVGSKSSVVKQVVKK